MVLDKLGSSLKDTLRKITRAVFVDERLVNELIRDIQRVLLAADVNVRLVFDLSKTIKNRALDEKIPRGVSKREHLVNIVYEELTKLLGSEKSEIKIAKKKPFKIMVVGLFGSGKTTTIGKLGRYYSKRGYKVAAIGLDVHRLAASEQLEQVCEKAKIKSFISKREKNPVNIYEKYETEYSKFDILIIDTAGRDALSRDLIGEIRDLNRVIRPDERILVISGDIGQAAQNQAEGFHKSCDITGIIATKLDGTARGGGALVAAAATKAAIKFIGVGEKVEDLEEFNPKGFVGRLLGMGDLEALLAKTREAISEEKVEDLGKKFLKGEFNFVDLYEQMKALRKMGPLNKILEMVPGMSQLKLPKEVLDVQDEKLKKWRYALDSMKKEELENPDILTSSRLERIARGAGVTVRDVRELLKQYKLAKKMIKNMKGSPEKLMKKFKGKIPGF